MADITDIRIGAVARQIRRCKERGEIVWDFDPAGELRASFWGMDPPPMVPIPAAGELLRAARSLGEAGVGRLVELIRGEGRDGCPPGTGGGCVRGRRSNVAA